MKKFWALISAVFATATALAFFSPGCTNPCDDLAELCGRCADPVYRASCEAIAGKSNGAVCSGEQKSFAVFCTAEGQGGAGGAATSKCTPAETLCVAQCVNLKANATFCGSCNTQCKQGELCVAGACLAADTCPVTLPDSNQQGGCTNRSSDPTCCGPDCSRCGAETVCVDGAGPNGEAACVAPEKCGSKICGGSCTSTFNDPLNCGACGQACKPGEVCSAGTCAATCATNLTQCCGKCVDITSNGAHCGGCDPSCPEVAGAGGAGGATSGADATSLQVCPSGQNVHQSCSGATPLCSGCACQSEVQCEKIESKTVCGESCVDLKTDPAHCGTCAISCAPGQKCSNGSCLSGDCPAGQSDCGGSCVDLQTSANHCGSCGNACDTSKSELCDSGLCVTSCTLPRQACGKSCVDVSKDPANCGACGTACANGQVCSPTADGSGACIDACPSGLTNCAGACVDLTQDFNHCGSCGNTCNDASVCTADSCVPGAKGGTCKNESGAALCGSSSNPCFETKCDPKLGCIVTPLSAGAIAAGCLNNPSVPKPGGWSSDDLQNTQTKCLWCDATKEGAAACVFADRLDSVACTTDACDPKRLALPTHKADNLFCQANGKDCASLVCNPDGNATNVDKTTGCVKDNTKCINSVDGNTCCPESTAKQSGCAPEMSCL